MTQLRVRYLAPLGGLLVAAVLITLLEGTPGRLPAVALGSEVLLHALRAGAPFAIGFAVATVLARAGAGRLPTQVSTSGVSTTHAKLLRPKPAPPPPTSKARSTTLGKRSLSSPPDSMPTTPTSNLSTTCRQTPH